MEDINLSGKASVIILTGFLGAGKTTLLNRILTADHGRRVGVIVNEFGEVGIDHHLLLKSEQEVVQMNNGCICCTVRGDLVRSFFQLMEHRSKFDTIVIETTGLAEPAPVAQSLYADERIRREFTLEGVVTVVDAKHISGQLDESAEAREQIAFADLILLNKTDLSTPGELDQIEERIGDLNSVAKVYRTRNSDLALAEIFDMGRGELAERIDRAEHDHPHHHGHGHAHRHLDVSSVCIVEPGDLDGLHVSRWFRALIAESGADILRMKGILNLRGDPEQFLFQGVQMEFEGKPGRPWREGEERLNRLVFIGRKLDQGKIAEGFRNCMSRANGNASSRDDPFGRDASEEVSPFTLDQIRYWMRQNFAFAKEVPIVIKEVPCVKPGCPPIETAIMAILENEPPRLFKVQQPINQITFDHVYDLIENPLPCC
ncbi:MAG TPA: GTP-binding protein [Xanthobacteraceae bacterium]|jgi:G3E family GTPase